MDQELTGVESKMSALKSYVNEEKKQIARAQALPRSLSSTASWLFPDIAADCAISLFTHLSDWCNVL